LDYLINAVVPAWQWVVNQLDALSGYTNPDTLARFVSLVWDNYDRIIQVISTDFSAVLAVLQNPAAFVFGVLETYLYPYLEDWLASLLGLSTGDLPPRRTLW